MKFPADKVGTAKSRPCQRRGIQASRQRHWTKADLLRMRSKGICSERINQSIGWTIRMIAVSPFFTLLPFDSPAINACP